MSNQIRWGLLSAWHGLEDFKDFPWRIDSDKVLNDKHFSIFKNPNYNRYNLSGDAAIDPNKFSLSNRQLVKKLHKPIIRKFWKFGSLLIVNIQLLSKCNEFLFHYYLPLKFMVNMQGLVWINFYD